ncbi:MAG: hypothetical protein RR293_02565 [Bacteroidales bacterium]
MKRLIFVIFVLYTASASSAAYYLDPIYKNDFYSNRIEDDGAYLWVASKYGLIHYEKSTEKCTLFNNVLIPKKAVIVSVFKDKKGKDLWIGTFEDESYKYDGNLLTRYSASTENYPYGPLYRSYSMAFDSENNPWIGGYWFYTDCAKNKNYVVADNAMSDCWENFAMDMAYDSKGKLWIAVDQRKYTYLASYENGDRSSTKVLQGTAATSLAIDSNDKIWLTCTDGIHNYDPVTKSDIKYSYDNNPDIPETIYTACDIDESGNIWFVGSNYLLKYDQSKFTYYNCNGFDQARSVYCDGPVVWVYTGNDDIFRFEGEKFTSVNIGTALSGIKVVENEGKDFTITYDKGGVVRISGDVEIRNINIYNVSGLLVASASYSGENNVTVEIPAISKGGIYLLKVGYLGGESIIKSVID